MNILLIHQYFNTPEQGGPLRSYYLAQGMLEHGHSVTVLTAHNGNRYKQVMFDGLTVHYLPVFYKNELGFIRRVWAFLKFLVLAVRKASQLGSFDLCYAISTPLTVGGIALSIKRKLNLPYYFEVGDLWPDAPIQMGVIKNPLLIRLLRKFERKIYADAEKVIALSPAIKQGVLQSCPQAQVEVFSNMSDCEFFQPSKKAIGAKTFTIFYFGAAGKANNLTYLIDAAHLAPANIRFLIAAKGSELARLKQQAQQLNQVEFLPYLNRADLKEYLDQVDAVYLSYANLPILRTGSPHKFFDGIAAGKLMILNFGGWLADLVLQHQCGVQYNPLRPEEMWEKITPYVHQENLLHQAQANARSLAEQEFSKQDLLNRLMALIEGQPAVVKESQAYTLSA